MMKMMFTVRETKIEQGKERGRKGIMNTMRLRCSTFRHGTEALAIEVEEERNRNLRLSFIISILIILVRLHAHHANGNKGPNARSPTVTQVVIHRCNEQGHGCS